MDVLLITKDGSLLGLADKLNRLNHKVLVHDYNSPKDSNEAGFYEERRNVLEAIQDCSFIVAESGELGEVYKFAKTYNRPIIGANQITDVLNSSYVREYELCSKFGLPYPRTIQLDGAADLYTNIVDWDSRFSYIKYERTFFSCEHRDWMAWSATKVPNVEMLLQESVDGIRIDVEGWFNGRDWIKPLFIKTETRPGGTKVLIAEKDKTKLASEILPKLRPFFRKIDYRGPVTAKLIVSKDAMHIISMKAGLDLQSFYALLEGIKDDPLDFLHSVAFGVGGSVDMTYDYCISTPVVRNKSMSLDGAPLVGLRPENHKHLFLSSVDEVEGNVLVNDTNPIIYVASSRGRAVNEAIRRVRRVIETVQFPMMSVDTLSPSLYTHTFEKLKQYGRL